MNRRFHLTNFDPGLVADNTWVLEVLENCGREMSMREGGVAGDDIIKEGGVVGGGDVREGGGAGRPDIRGGIVIREGGAVTGGGDIREGDVAVGGDFREEGWA